MVPNETSASDRTFGNSSPSTLTSIALALLVVTSVLGAAAAPAAGSSADAPDRTPGTADRASGASTAAAPAAGSSTGASGGTAAGSTADARPTDTASGARGAAGLGGGAAALSLGGPAAPSAGGPAGIEFAGSDSAAGGAGGTLPAEVAGANCPRNLGDDACITGRFVYKLPGGGTAPARQVEVKLVDDDVINHGLKTVRTDDRGRFAVVFDPEEVEWGTEGTVFLKLFAENPAAKATKGALRQRYKAVTSTMRLSPGERKAMGTFWPDEYNPAWRGVDWTLTAHRSLEAKAGLDREQIRIQYPPITSDRPQAVSIPGFRHVALTDPDERSWSRATVYHEYGHMVMDTMYEENPAKWPVLAAEYIGVCHVEDSETNPDFAWIEGWAEFFSAVVADDSGARGRNLEHGSVYDTADSNGDCPPADADGTFDGAKVEGSTSRILWDLYDGGPGDDDGLDYSLGRIMSVFDSSDATDSIEFYSAVVTDDNRAELREIYYRQGILRPDRFESNNDRGSAATLTPNATVKAQINGNDGDYYAVDVGADVSLSASLDPTVGSGNVDLAVYGPGGEQLAADLSAAPGASVSVVTGESGTYYVAAMDDDGTSVPYELDVTTSDASGGGDLPDLGWWDDRSWYFDAIEVGDGIVDIDPPIDIGFGNGSGTPDAVDCGETVTVRGDAANGTDTYTIDLSSDCGVDLQLSGPADADLDLYVTLDGRTPSPGNYDRRSRDYGSRESISLDAENVDDRTTLGIAVDPYRGGGNYTLTITGGSGGGENGSERSADTTVVWRGFRHAWSYNHRVARIGSWVDTNGCDADGCAYTVGHSGASGSGEDRAAVRDAYTELSARGVGFEGGTAEIHLTGSEKKPGPKSQVISGTEWVTVPDSGTLSDRDTYVAVLNGFDLAAKGDRLKFVRFSVETTDVRRTSGGLEFGIRYRVLLDCDSVECVGVAGKGVSTVDYSFDVRYLLVGGDAGSFNVADAAKSSESYSWDRCKNNKLHTDSWFRQRGRHDRGIGHAKNSVFPGNHMNCEQSEGRELDYRNHVSSQSVDGKTGYSVAVPGIRGFTLDLHKEAHFTQYDTVVGGSYDAASGTYHLRTLAFFKEWSSRPGQFADAWGSYGHEGSATVSVDPVVMQFGQGCKRSFVHGGGIHFETSHEDKTAPTDDIADRESSRSFQYGDGWSSYDGGNDCRRTVTHRSSPHASAYSVDVWNDRVTRGSPGSVTVEDPTKLQHRFNGRFYNESD